MKVCCHLVQLKKQPPPVLLPSASVGEKERHKGGKWRNRHWKANEKPWITSSVIKSLCTEWGCSARWGSLLVSQRASSVSLYCTVTPPTSNKPTYYYKPHTQAHHCYTEWTVDWKREWRVRYTQTGRMCVCACASRWVHYCKLFLRGHFCSALMKPTPATRIDESLRSALCNDEASSRQPSCQQVVVTKCWHSFLLAH